jgi:hypothetical protein
VISIIFEAATAVTGVLLALKKNKKYGWYIALTFTIWVFYDILRFLPNVSPRAYLTLPVDLLYSFFFIAALSIFYAVWSIFKEA